MIDRLSSTAASAAGRAPEPPPGGPRGGRRWVKVLLFLAVAAVVVGVGCLALAGGLGLDGTLVLSALLVLGSLALWGSYRLLRVVLWSVGRRLAFTYLLIGVLPIPMAVVLVGVGLYLSGGFFLGHLFRDANAVVYEQVRTAAETRLEQPRSVSMAPSAGLEVAVAYYLEGRRVGGDGRAPIQWPSWLEREVLESEEGIDRRDRTPPLVALPDGDLTVATAKSRGSVGVVAFFDGHLETRLRELSQVWIDFGAEQEEQAKNSMDVNILGERFVLRPLSRQRAEDDRLQFLSRGGAEPAFWVYGFDVAGESLSLATGELESANLPVSLVGTPRLVLGQLLSSSREVDTLAWVTFVIPAFLLFDIFVVAWVMAVFMVFGLSRAVNRLSAATNALQLGDFSVRIPVRRRDQIGSLHASFNEMAASLEDLIATKTQKESLEKELEIARELQESLMPNEIVQGKDVEFATHFEPSAAIGGDYFDILRLDQRRMAVVIADVSGHGLSAGLRMAMVKAALGILVEEEREPQIILERLDRVVRSSKKGPSFVTATLALLDLVDGRIELVNAGHPPTYILRDGEVNEVMLPGAPLGALGDDYGRATIELQPGDSVVWLSDGFIEAANPSGELFGYERTVECLRGTGRNATMVRDRLLAPIRE